MGSKTQDLQHTTLFQEAKRPVSISTTLELGTPTRRRARFLLITHADADFVLAIGRYPGNATSDLPHSSVVAIPKSIRYTNRANEDAGTTYLAQIG